MKTVRSCKYDPELRPELKIEDVRPPTITAPIDLIVKVGTAHMCRTDRKHFR